MSKNNQPGQNCLAWSITTSCNYSCSYCLTVNRNLKKNITCPDPKLFLSGFDKYLKGSWKFYICGSGEPFLAPGFLDVVRRLVDKGHKITVVTNFSPPIQVLLKFCEITGENLVHLAASLHLECEDPAKFLRKALTVANIVGDKLSVWNVAIPGKVLETAKIGEKFKKNGIKFYFKKKRVKADGTQKIDEYSDKELRLIHKSIFHGISESSSKNCFKGKECWAGSKYFVINEMGEAWRCYPAFQSHIPDGYLGNLVKGTFRLKQGQLECLYDYCYCIQPILHEFMDRLG